MTIRIARIERGRLIVEDDRIRDILTHAEVASIQLVVVNFIGRIGATDKAPKFLFRQCREVVYPFIKEMPGFYLNCFPLTIAVKSTRSGPVGSTRRAAIR